MAARNNHPFRSGSALRQSEASRREIVFSFASVLSASACIYAVTQFLVRMPA